MYFSMKYLQFHLVPIYTLVWPLTCSYVVGMLLHNMLLRHNVDEGNASMLQMSTD